MARKTMNSNMRNLPHAHALAWSMAALVTAVLGCSSPGDDAGACGECGDHGECQQSTGECMCGAGYEGAHCERCANGFVRDGDACVPGSCVDDSDCDDEDACNGQETCSTEHSCQPATPVVCAAHASCQEPTGSCVCDPGYELDAGSCVPILCEPPQAPTLSIIHAGATLTWSTLGQATLQVGTGSATASSPDAWHDTSSVTLPSDGLPYEIRAFARVKDPSCTSAAAFSFPYRVHEAYPPAVGEPETEAIAMDDERIVGWATGWHEPVAYGSDLDEGWKTPHRAVGPAQGTTADVVSLGRGGSIIMVFDPPIANGSGPDLAVFENAFIDSFLELAYVEVSSNGTDFVRFDSAYLGTGSIGGFSGHDAWQIGSLAGKYRQGYGTPFDLEVFILRPQVRSGLVDLGAIRYVRIVDVVGDGSALDSFGNAIFDPYPTVGSAGFDVDAIAVLNAG